jgi:hypothetical protein
MHLPNSVGEPRSALVEHDQTTAGRKPFDVPHEQRLIPRRDEIPCDPTDEDDVRPALANDLIGDRDVAAAGVLNVWELHGKSLSDRAVERYPT